MTDFANDVISWGSTPTELSLLDLMKQMLGIVDTARDAELSMYLDMAGNAAERYIDNIIEQREVTERISKKYVPVPLRYYPVTTVTSVQTAVINQVFIFRAGNPCLPGRVDIEPCAIIEREQNRSGQWPKELFVHRIKWRSFKHQANILR